jgi:isocitrate dehydrogenase
MSYGDFYSSEKSAVLAAADDLKITLTTAAGETQVLKESVPVHEGEVVDATVMNRNKLRAFFESTMQAARAEGVLLSLHMKATMMKVSDPIIFGHAVSVYYRDVFEKHAATFATLGLPICMYPVT